MREGPLDILDRSRYYFLKSLSDGIDKADSAADFYFNSISAQRKGYLLSADDTALVKMVYHVMKDEKYGEGGIEQTGDMSMDSAVPMMATDYLQIRAGNHLAGQQLVDGSYQDNRVVAPDAKQGLAGYHPTMQDGDPNDPYATHDFFGSEFNPLQGRYHHHLGDFYVNPSRDGYSVESESQRAHHKELAWDEHNSQLSNAFLLDASHYGELDAKATSHSLYEQDFANWEINNDRAIASRRLELENQGLSDDEIDHQVALDHINEKKQEWKHNLGFWDYLFGMEWMTPEQRNMAYDHIHRFGTDDSQSKFNGHKTGHAHDDWLPRFKRSFAQRFAGMYDHWVRDPTHPGSGGMQKRVRLPDDAGIVGVEDNFRSLTEHTVEGQGNAYDLLMSYLLERTGIERQDNHGKPYIHTDAATEAEAQVAGVTANFANGGKNIQFRSTTPPKKGGKSADAHYSGINREMHRLLLNIDNDGNIYRDGEHPLYPNWEASDSPLSQTEINKILARAESEPRKKFSARIGQNENAFMVGDAIDHNTYPEYAMEGDDKPHETLSTYWQKPWIGGGMAKPPNQLFDLLHQASLMYEMGDNPPVYEDKPKDGDKSVYTDAWEKIKEAEEGERQYPIKRNKHGQHESLLFSRSKRHINARHDHDSEGGLESGASVLGLIASFAQPQHELTRMNVGGKEKTTSITGDATDAPTNLNPHNKRFSSSISGHSPSVQVMRHATCFNPAFINRMYSEYHNAREATGRFHKDLMSTEQRYKEYQRIRQMISNGKDARVLPISNAFTGSGGAYEFNKKIDRNAHTYHRIGSMWRVDNPPLSPGTGIQQLSPASTHTTYGGHQDLKDLEIKDPEGVSIQTPQELNAYIDNLDKEFRNELAKLEAHEHKPEAWTEQLPDGTSRQVQFTSEEMKEQRIDALKGEYQRKIERLQQKFTHDPSSYQTLQAGDKRITMARVNPAAQMTEEEDKRLAMRQAPEAYLSEDEDELNRLTETAGQIMSQLDDKELSAEDRERLTHKLHDLNEEIAAKDRAIVHGAKTRLNINDEAKGAEHEQYQHASKAFEDAANHVRKMLGDYHNELFDPNLSLETLEANVRMFAKMVNDYLHIAPHEAHGLTTMGIDDRAVERPMAGAALTSDIKRVVHDSPVKVGIKDLIDYKGLVEKLGLPDYDSNPHVQHTITNFLDMFEKKFVESGHDPNFQLPVMTVGQYLKETGKVDPDMDFEEEIVNLKTNKKSRKEDLFQLTNQIDRLVKPFQGKGVRGAKADIDKMNEQAGLMYHVAHNGDHRLAEPTTQRVGSKSGQRGSSESKPEKKVSDAYNTQQVLQSLLFSDPNIEPREAQSVSTSQIGFGKVPIDAFGPNSHSVPSIYNSNGLRHEFGERVTPSFDYHIAPNGEIRLRDNKKPMRLLNPLQNIFESIAPHLSHMLHPDYTHHNGSTKDDLLGKDRQGAHKHMDSMGVVNSMDTRKVGKSEMGLASLTNPDIIRKELGKEVPLLQPMHRIFKLADLEHLRGFTGDWIVSVMPEGERGFVKKDDDEISAKPFTLSKEDKENFKKVTDNNFHADVIKTEDGYYIFDVIEYDDKEVHDTLLDDRIKILRGGMEGVENIHVPSASDTRLTDDAGLELIVEDLQKEHDKLILRDAKSTYMVGEMRHPKWVMLNEGNDVVLRVLERRGGGPYTYRLGTGPITQEDDLGDRGVESGGETYMDVGAAFDSPDKYNEGDHVRVNVSNVAESEASSGQKLYTVSSSDVKEEAEGEGLVSQETLGMLSKSESTQWLCELSRASSGVRVTMPQGDVLYKCTQTGNMWTVHSPLASNSYLIRLSESQRQYWSPVAGALLKAGLEIREEEDENGGFSADGIEPGEPLVKPKKVKGTDWWDEEQKKKVLVKGLQLVEKLIKSGAGSVGQSSTGAMGLGIGYGTPIESPTGPTNLHDEKTMPDFDARKRPGEDSYIEPGAEDSEPAKHMTIPLEGGTLEVTGESATFRT